MCETQQNPWAGITVRRLYDDVARGKTGQLRQGEGEVITIDDHERPRSRYARRDPGEGHFQERMISSDSAVLFGNRDASDVSSQLAQPDAVAARQHERPRDVTLPAESFGCGRTAARHATARGASI